jgi:hypothetical protein
VRPDQGPPTGWVAYNLDTGVSCSELHGQHATSYGAAVCCRTRIDPRKPALGQRWVPLTVEEVGELADLLEQAKEK